MQRTQHFYKECKRTCECCVLLKRMRERCVLLKRTQECCVLLKRAHAQPCYIAIINLVTVYSANFCCFQSHSESYCTIYSTTEIIILVERPLSNSTLTLPVVPAALMAAVPPPLSFPESPPPGESYCTMYIQHYRNYNPSYLNCTTFIPSYKV